MDAGLSPSAGRDENLGTLAGHDLLAEVGRGSSGVVYKARHRRLARLAAIKTLLPGWSDADALRLRQEAEATAALDHPTVVRVHGFGVEGGRPYLALEWIEGRSLAQLLREGPLESRAAAWLMARVAEAVHHAHLRGVLHGALHADHVLLDTAGLPRVIGFRSIRRGENGAGLTPNHFSVTGSYRIPESAHDAPLRNQAADVRDLGILLREMLGPPAGPGGDSQAPAPLRNVPADRDLNAVYRTCLRRQPKRTYRSAEALAADLNRWLTGQMVRARPRRWSMRLAVRLAALLGAW
jgi:serine/threonine-protein kinase